MLDLGEKKSVCELYREKSTRNCGNYFLKLRKQKNIYIELLKDNGEINIPIVGETDRVRLQKGK